MIFDTIQGTILDVEEAIAKGFFGSPMFLYGAGFADSNMVPFHNPLGLANLLTFTSTGTPAPHTAAAFLPVSSRFPHGALQVTLERRGSPDELIAFGVLLPNFPRNLSSFRIMATFSTPSGPHGPSDAWAVVMHARESAATPTADRIKTILVTLQSAWNSAVGSGRPGARMNTPKPPPGGTPGPWLPWDIYDLLFPGVVVPVTPPTPPSEPVATPFVPEPVFTLQMDVDRDAASGQCTLYVKAPGAGFIVDPGPGYAVAHAQSRVFDHPFMNRVDANSSVNVIGSAGVNLAIADAGGDGPVSVIIEDFKVFGTRDPGLLGVFELFPWPAPVKQMIGEARSRFTDWVFAREARRMAKSRLGGT